MLTCAIIDDDEINRLTLEHYISLTPDLELKASLADGIAGLAYLRKGPSVDVLFLDIEMPHLNGLEMLRLLQNPPEVIITTARNDFAVDAFELRVTDYLVKPFEGRGAGARPAPPGQGPRHAGQRRRIRESEQPHGARQF